MNEGKGASEEELEEVLERKLRQIKEEKSEEKGVGGSPEGGSSYVSIGQRS